MEEPGRRTRHRVERRSNVALGNWHRAIPALSLRCVRGRPILRLVLD
jgi:hypothetical protein